MPDLAASYVMAPLELLRNNVRDPYLLVPFQLDIEKRTLNSKMFNFFVDKLKAGNSNPT